LFCDKKDHERKIADCNQANRLDSNYSDVYNKHGIVYYTKDD